MKVVTCAENVTLQADGLVSGLAYSKIFQIPSGMQHLGMVLTVHTLTMTGGGAANVVVQPESTTDGGNEWTSDLILLVATPGVGSVLVDAPVTYSTYSLRLELTYAGPPATLAWATFDVHVRYSKS
jgi:hypothetical protein